MSLTVDGHEVGDALISASPERLQELRGQFAEQHWVKLPGFFSPGLIDRAATDLAEAEFQPLTNDNEIGVESRMQPNGLSASLLWLMNAPGLLSAAREITGCEEISSFFGRVFRLEPSSGQSFDWHDDLGDPERRVAISVNLGKRPFAGGTLQIRERDATELIAEVTNLVPGDAVLFRIARHLQHRVMPVEGTVPRVAFAGWFLAGHDYYSSLLRTPAGAESV